MANFLHYFPQLSSLQKDKLQGLIPLYKEWNSKINVLSRKEDPELWAVNHILHSLSIAKFIDFKPGTAVMDLGTGGGFPGIPLAIVFPQTSFYQIDSIGKKIKVVQSIAKTMNLDNVRAEQIRGEDVSEQFDFVVSRAVAPLCDIHSWVHNKIKRVSVHEIKNGLICLKGGDLASETLPYKEKVQIIPISNFFDEAFFETKQIVYLPI